MHTMVQVNKSSIKFLLSDSQNKKNKEELVYIEPKTFPKTVMTKPRKITRPSNPELSLQLLQQPTHAKVTPRLPTRVFPPFAEHRPIHPPPVLQLKVNGFKPRSEDRCELTDEYLSSLVNPNDHKSVDRVEELRVIRQLRENKMPTWTHYSTFFVIARLRSEDEQDVSHLFHGNQYMESSDDLLLGTKVSSGMCVPLKLVSPSNSFLRKTLPKETLLSSDFATTFVFSDLSVKKVGKFKLRFDLFEVFDGKVYKRCEATSEEFQVFTPKKFPGSSPSTPLTAFLFKQGARIRQRKRPSQRRSSSQVEEDDSNNKVRKISDPGPSSLSNRHQSRRLLPNNFQKSGSSDLISPITSRVPTIPSSLPTYQTQPPYSQYQYSNVLPHIPQQPLQPVSHGFPSQPSWKLQRSASQQRYPNVIPLPSLPHTPQASMYQIPHQQQQYLPFHLAQHQHQHQQAPPSQQQYFSSTSPVLSSGGNQFMAPHLPLTQQNGPYPSIGPSDGTIRDYNAANAQPLALNKGSQR